MLRLLWPPALGLLFGLIVAVLLRDGRDTPARGLGPTPGQVTSVNVDVLPPSLPRPTLRTPRPISSRSARLAPMAPRPAGGTSSATPTAGDPVTRAARARRSRLELAATGEVTPPLR